MDFPQISFHFLECHLKVDYICIAVDTVMATWQNLRDPYRKKALNPGGGRRGGGGGGGKKKSGSKGSSVTQQQETW